MTDLECVRLQPADPKATPLPRPLYFDHRYVLPSHRVKLLETKHAHPRDARIVFYEEPHIYTVDGNPVQMSVSGLPAEFESEFDAQSGINAMKRSRRIRWPRIQYVINPRRIAHVDEFEGRYGGMIVDADTNDTIASVEPGTDANGIIMYTVLRDTATREVDNEAWYVFDRCMTDEEIRHKWELNGEDSRNRGTEAHLQMELWFNSEPVRMDDEVKVGLDFVRKCLVPIGVMAYRTEWTIFAEEEDVAGCIDLAVTMPSGDIYLIDWKRSEKLQKKMHGYAPMTAPLNHLEDCSGCAYALQLGCYQYILEKYYGKRVVGRALASIHPAAPFTTAVPYLREEVGYLMARRRAMASTRRQLSNDAHSSLLCALSGLLVVNAVRDANNTLYDAKVAKLHDIEVVPCQETSARAANLLNENMPVIAIAPGLQSWRERFPKPTDDLLHFA